MLAFSPCCRLRFLMPLPYARHDYFFFFAVFRHTPSFSLYAIFMSLMLLQLIIIHYMPRLLPQAADGEHIIRRMMLRRAARDVVERERHAPCVARACRITPHRACLRAMFYGVSCRRVAQMPALSFRASSTRLMILYIVFAAAFIC